MVHTLSSTINTLILILEALRAGLVSRVSPKGEAKAEALNVANEIIKFSKPVIAMGKAFFYTQIELNVHTANR